MRGAQHGSPPWGPSPKPAGAGDGQVRVSLDYAVPRHRQPPRRVPWCRASGRAVIWAVDWLMGLRVVWLFGRWPVPRWFLIFMPVMTAVIVVALGTPPSWWAYASAHL